MFICVNMLLKPAIFFYQMVLQLYYAVLGFARMIGHKKAVEFFAGRRSTGQQLQTFSQGNQKKVIWMHCASVGEFEQGKPVLQALKMKFPTYAVCVSFFSPSGYLANKNYEADWVGYLPLDSKANAEQFLNTLKPHVAIFVKYEYWWFYLTQLRAKQIPTLLVAGSFRGNQPFFKWYGVLHKQMLHCFTQIFVQTKSMQQLLESLGIKHVQTCGDPRFDRVLELASQPKLNASVEHFASIHAHKTMLVAGSTWPADEVLLASLLVKENLVFIIAPHNVDEASVAACKAYFPNHQLLSQYEPSKYCNVLIIDCIGLLSSLYRHAHITYVGGGFSKDGIHNVLEAAVYGKPVICGPNIKKYWEAQALETEGGLYRVTNATEINAVVTRSIENKAWYQNTCHSAKKFVEAHAGATGLITNYIYENRLLTKSSK